MFDCSMPASAMLKWDILLRVFSIAKKKILKSTALERHGYGGVLLLSLSNHVNLEETQDVRAPPARETAAVTQGDIME